MNRLLGRGESPGPSKNWLLSTVVALLLAFVAWDRNLHVPKRRGLDAIAAVVLGSIFDARKNFPNPTGNYQVLSKIGPDKGNTAWPRDARRDARPLGGWPSFALTAKARQAGAVALKVDTVHYTSAQMNRMLAEQIYCGPVAR